VSQSGESLDTLLALREARQRGARVLGVTNVVDSSMARESDGVLYTRAGPEIGVAATKTLLAQIVAMELLALTLAQVHGTLSAAEIARILDDMHRLPDALDEVIGRQKEVDEVAEAVFAARDFFFLGRNVGYPVALEGALKLKELSYLHAEGYPAGELKHGPIALIEPGTVVVGIATRNRLSEKFASNIAEVKARGASIVLVANDGDEHAEQATATGDPGCLDLRVHADELGAAQLAELSVLQAAHERAPLVRRELQNRPGPVLLGVPDGDDAGQIGCHLHTAHSRGGRSWFRIACRSMRPATSSSTSASVVFGRPESTTRA